MATIRVRIDAWPNPNGNIGEEAAASADGMFINRQTMADLIFNGLFFFLSLETD